MAEVLVVADDLTGANATGARFARLGMRTITVAASSGIGARVAGCDVLVVDTASCRLAAVEAAARVRAVVDAVRSVPLLVKRIDTTLRGNIGAEVDAALDALAARGERARALVVPAFPAAGRTTVGGLQLVDGAALVATDAARDPTAPVASSRVATVVRRQSARSIGEVPLDVVMAGGADLVAALSGPEDLVICDALTDGDVTAVARAAAEVARAGAHRWLAVDPGPMATALAGALGLVPAGPPAPPVLVVAGSATPATRRQLLELERVVGARFVDVDLASAAGDRATEVADVTDVARRVVAALDGAPHGAVVGLRTAATAEDVVDLGSAAAQGVPAILGAVVAEVLARRVVGGLYVTGGDVATGVLAALGAHGLRIDGEVLPLAVAGRLLGGDHDGLPVVTKGGLIGGPDAAVRSVEHLRGAAGRRRVPDPPPDGTA